VLSELTGSGEAQLRRGAVDLFKIFSFSYLHSPASNAKKSIPTGTDNPV
jgi:hypothetical protein